MGAQLFVKAFNEVQYRRLDLFAEEPIKISLSVANIVDPLAANSIFSRTFRVPHTSVNGPFLMPVRKQMLTLTIMVPSFRSAISDYQQSTLTRRPITLNTKSTITEKPPTLVRRLVVVS